MAGSWARLLDSLPLDRDRPLLAYSTAIIVSMVALTLRFAAGNVMPTGFPYVGFFPAVIITAFVCGIGPGIVTATICGVFAWYFFIPPVDTFKMTAAVAVTLGFYALVVAINLVVLHWMQTANARLRVERERNRQLAERSNLLFRELQHRVSNNLQVVGGLLALQKRDIDDHQAKGAIDEAARRLGLIGRIHRQLYDPSGEQLRLTNFLNQLVADLIDTSGRKGISCSVEAQEDLLLEPDAAVPMALIVAESISNAIEHGFAVREEGAIVIRAAKRDAMAVITVTDDGAGLPAGFDLSNTESLGLRLAQMLALQLGGEFTLVGGAGTTAMLRIPV